MKWFKWDYLLYGAQVVTNLVIIVFLCVLVVTRPTEQELLDGLEKGIITFVDSATWAEGGRSVSEYQELTLAELTVREELDDRTADNQRLAFSKLPIKYVEGMTFLGKVVFCDGFLFTMLRNKYGHPVALGVLGQVCVLGFYIMIDPNFCSRS